MKINSALMSATELKPRSDQLNTNTGSRRETASFDFVFKKFKKYT